MLQVVQGTTVQLESGRYRLAHSERMSGQAMARGLGTMKKDERGVRPESDHAGPSE